MSTQPPGAHAAAPGAPGSTGMVMPPADSIPTMAGRTPGEELARTLGEEAGADRFGETIVELPLSLPTTFPFFVDRPRYTVRHLLGTTDVADGDEIPYVQEPADAQATSRSGVSYAGSLEAAFRPRVERAPLTWVTVTVPVPDKLTAYPDLLARYVDRRVVVRVGTLENEILLHGSADAAIPGLLTVPGRRVVQGSGPLDTALTRAAALVEETGGSCDGIVVHPVVYWAMVESGQLARFNQVGVRVSRTRMIPRGQALLADFRAVATLLDPARSRLVFRRAAGPGEDDVIEASHRLGLAVHLPQHLVLLDLGDAAPAS
jgi:hypothetical protein